jgi:hypothetical protein
MDPMVLKAIQSMEKSLQELQSVMKAPVAAQSYKVVVRNGPYVQMPSIAKQWRPIDPKLKAKNLAKVKARVEAIKNASKSQLYCLNYGDRGHLAQACRNATFCFLCEKLGHKFFQCRAAAHPSYLERL